MNEMKLHTAADSIPGSVTLFGMETPFCSLPLGHHCLCACSRACVKCHETITIGGGTMNNKPKTAQTRTTPCTKHRRQSHSRSSHPNCSLWTLSVAPHVWVSCYQCWGSWLCIQSSFMSTTMLPWLYIHDFILKPSSSPTRPSALN